MLLLFALCFDTLPITMLHSTKYIFGSRINFWFRRWQRTKSISKNKLSKLPFKCCLRVKAVMFSKFRITFYVLIIYEGIPGFQYYALEMFLIFVLQNNRELICRLAYRISRTAISIVDSRLSDKPRIILCVWLRQGKQRLDVRLS